MAVIGKIQKNSVLLLIVIGLAMLAFIFTDFLKDPGGQVEQISSATLNGEGIDEAEYERLRDDIVTRDRNNAAYQNKPYTKSDERISEDKAFNELIRKNLLDAEIEKLGLAVTKAEMNDMIHGKNIHPWVLQVSMFNGASGFSKDSVKKFLSNLENEPLDPANLEAWQNGREQWRDFERQLRTARSADKYVSLIRKGVYVTQLEAEEKQKAMFTKKNVKYIVQRYADIPEDEVSVSEDEVKEYYEAHKSEKKYEQEEGRTLDMVFFPVVPTEADRAAGKSLVKNLMPGFESAEDPIAYVRQNSDAKLLSDSTVFKYSDTPIMTVSKDAGTYPKAMDAQVQKLEVGEVFGPFSLMVNTNATPGANLKGEEHVAIARVIEMEKVKYASVRHILISSQNKPVEKAKAMADSVMAIVRANNNFEEMVAAVSEDPGSKANGGKYEYFTEGMMVPEFNDASFNGPIGQLQLVKTDYGYHIVEVLEQVEKNAPILAMVTKKVKPSDLTLKETEERLYDFIYVVNDAKESDDSAFYKVARDSSFEIQTAQSTLSNNFLTGITSPDRVMRFAYNNNAEMGDVSDPILDNDKYVVAYISNLIQEGTPEFKDVKVLMEKEALREKQAEHYIEKMSGKKGLDEVATVVTTGVIRETEVVFDNSIFQKGAQKEPAIVGTVFTEIPVGAMTKPLKGEEGIFVLIVESETPAETLTDYSNVIKPMEVKRLGAADNGVIEALRDKANLKDNRQRKKYQQ
jgi:peptidyl-prolyl cis-trans isomerase D